MIDQTIIERLADQGIDYARLKACLDSRDNWGSMVHAFEYLTVCEVVLGALRDPEYPVENYRLRAIRAEQQVLELEAETERLRNALNYPGRGRQ